MAMSGTTATLLAQRMVRKEEAKIVFVLRDGKYYLAEFWCASCLLSRSDKARG